MKTPAFTINLATALSCFLMGSCDPNFGGIGCSSCPEDVPIPTTIKKYFPYQRGSIVRFASNSLDTIEFVCAQRKEFIEIGYPSGNIEVECCDEYEIEGVEFIFENNGTNSYYLKNSNYGYISIYSNLNIDNDEIKGNWKLIGWKSEPVTLVGRTFDNVILGELDSVYLEPDSIGIVGFIKNGKAWRKL